MSIQWSLVLFTALTGTAGWMFASIAVAQVKGVHEKAAFPAALTALIVLIVGGCASVTHLSHPDRMMGALSHPTSGIFTEAVLVGITAVFAIILLIMLKRGASKGGLKAMAILAAIFGVVLSFSAGASYMMPARASWNTVLMPLGYMGTVIPAGVAAYLVCAKAAGEDDLSVFPKFLLCGGIVGAVLAAIYVAVSAGPDAALLGWCLAVVVGGALPAVFGALMEKKPESAMALAALSLACALVGSIAFRCYMWTAATTVDNFFSII